MKNNNWSFLAEAIAALGMLARWTDQEVQERPAQHQNEMRVEGTQKNTKDPETGVIPPGWELFSIAGNNQETCTGLPSRDT